MGISKQNDEHTARAPHEDWDDLTILRWVHERLGVMGYEPTDEHDEQHPTAWWEARRKRWAQALEAQAQLLSARLG